MDLMLIHIILFTFIDNLLSYINKNGIALLIRNILIFEYIDN